MSNNPFKFTSHFESEIEASCVDGSCKMFNVSEASLESLKTLIPEDVDLDKNIDLMAVAFNAAVVNRFNKNGDGIDTATALAIKDYFIHKPTNIEHQKNKVVGHIISSSFSEYGTNKILEASELEDEKGAFNIALGALVYKIVNPTFAKLLEQSQEEGEFKNIVSASWEIGFNDYVIAVGSDDLSQAEIVSDKKQIEEFNQYLKAYDGEGKMDDGTPIFRLVVGDIYPLGIGFTTNPAADVKGVIMENSQAQNLKKQASSNEKIEIDNQKLYNKSENNCSLLKENSVNNTNEITMDNQDLLKQIEGMLSEKIGDSQQFEEAVASVSKVMMEAIREKDASWQDEKEQKEKALAEATERQETLSKELEEVKEKLTASEEQWNELAEEKRLREAKDLFNSRMASVTEAFDLNEEDLKIVASEVSELESTEEAFASYEDKLKVMWQHKTKAFIEEQEKLFQEKLEAEIKKRVENLSESTASEEVSEESSEEASEEVAEEVLENVEEESAASISNNNEAASTEEQSLREKFNTAFTKENININY